MRNRRKKVHRSRCIRTIRSIRTMDWIFVDCLVHLDDAPFESGALRVVPGSHKEGPREHITGEGTAPHLPTDKFHPDFIDSIPISGASRRCYFLQLLPSSTGRKLIGRISGGKRCDSGITPQRCVLSDVRPKSLITILWLVGFKVNPTSEEVMA